MQDMSRGGLVVWRPGAMRTTCQCVGLVLVSVQTLMAGVLPRSCDFVGDWNTSALFGRTARVRRRSFEQWVERSETGLDCGCGDNRCGCRISWIGRKREKTLGQGGGGTNDNKREIVRKRDTCKMSNIEYESKGKL
jgi:hypothetical protein